MRKRQVRRRLSPAGSLLLALVVTTLVASAERSLNPPPVEDATAPTFRVSAKRSQVPGGAAPQLVPRNRLDQDSAAPLSPTAGPFVLLHNVVAGGGGSGTGGSFKIDGTIGETAAGVTMTGAPFAVTGGFWALPFAPTASDGEIGGRTTASDGTPISGAVITLTGSQSRQTITDANGNYHFYDVETGGFYIVTPSRANYNFNPFNRSFSQLGNRTEATFTATSIGNNANPLDTPEYFVRQHYLDFLGREPDDAGLNFWSEQIRGCGNDFNCIERRTINVSAAYFLSIEFQETDGLVDGLYRASYGRAPLYKEFMPDTVTVAHDVIVGNTGWEQLLAANKRKFLDEWVQRAAFRAAYDNLGDDSYVDTLISHTGVTFTDGERAAIVSGLIDGTLSRAGVLQRVAQNERFVKAKFNEAFVRMQYFGYLRRDPDDSGFHFWLNKLNEFDGNFERAEMVKAFLVSGEYRERFRP